MSTSGRRGTTRTYGDGCGIARALDIVGERWAALVVRELIFGPLRYTDLQCALPTISTNLLSARLRELVDDGLIAKRQLSRPSAARVYELTDWGRELEPILLSLGAWGLRAPAPRESTLSPTSVMLFLRGAIAIDRQTPPLTVGIVLHERAFAVRAANGQIEIAPGKPEHADASIQCSPNMWYRLLCNELTLTASVRQGEAVTEGSRTHLQAIIDLVHYAPSPPAMKRAG
jgi:DNA-binding HxlR family transcriptional regulator